MKKIALILAIITVLVTCCTCFGSFADDELVNLFDKTTITKSRVSHLGILKDKTWATIYEKYSVSDFIPVKGGDTVYFANADSTQQQSVPVVEFFNSEKSYFKFFSTSNVSYAEVGSHKGLAVGSFTAPDGSAYMKFNFLSGGEKSFAVTVNQAMTYNEYCELVGREAPVIRTDSPLYGKTVLFVGDSITEAAADWNTYDYKHCIGWAGRIGFYNDMNYQNKGLSGASISNCRGSNLVVNQLMNSLGFGKTCDFIIMHGGVNDAWDNAPVGEMTDSFDTADFDRDTFAGGLEYTFAYAKKNFPNVQLGYIINFRLTSTTGSLNKMGPYFDVAKQICDKWEIPYLDLFSDDDLNIIKLKVNSNLYLPDKIHPNGAGYDIITPYIQSWMESLVEAEAPATPTPIPTPTPTPEPTPEDTTPVNTVVPETTPATDATPTSEPASTPIVPIVIGIVAAVAVIAVVVVVVLKKKK